MQKRKLKTKLPVETLEKLYDEEISKKQAEIVKSQASKESLKYLKKYPSIFAKSLPVKVYLLLKSDKPEHKATPTIKISAVDITRMKLPTGISDVSNIQAPKTILNKIQIQFDSKTGIITPRKKKYDVSLNRNSLKIEHKNIESKLQLPKTKVCPSVAVHNLKENLIFSYEIFPQKIAIPFPSVNCEMLRFPDIQYLCQQSYRFRGFPKLVKGSLKEPNLLFNVTPAPVSQSKTAPTLHTASVSPRYLEFNTHFEIVKDYTYQDFVKPALGLMEGEIMNLLEEMFNARGYLPRGGSEVLDKPILVVVGENKKDWHTIIAYILSELYREIKGEKPVPTFRELENEESVDSTVEKFLMVNYKAWGKIELVDARNFNQLDFKSMIKKLKGRLLSSYLQGFGFIVMVTKNEHINDILKLLDDVKGIDKIVFQPEHRTIEKKLVVPLSEKEIDDNYRRIVFSVLGFDGDDFLKTLEIRDSKIRATLKSFSPFVTRTESETEHYPLKVAVFSWIIRREFENLNVKPKSKKEFMKYILDILERKVFIEKSVGDIIPDIIYHSDDKKICIEIETLAGCGDPIAKIQATISKYLNRGNIDGELWIVIKPVSALIHYDDLKNLKEIYEFALGKDNPIHFKVLVYKNDRWDLIDLDNFIGGLKI